MARALEINDALLDQIDKELAGIGVMHRMPALKAGIRRAADIVLKRYRDMLPMPGYPGDKPGLKPLRDTIQTKVREYGSGTVFAVVGAAYPAGAHGHLFEEDHEKVLWGKRTGGVVRGRGLLERVVERTATDRDAAVLNGIREAIEQARKSGGTGL